MAQTQSEIRYLTPMSVDVKKKKYCRFKRFGINYDGNKKQSSPVASPALR